MSETIITFQSQLCGVMETVLKAAMCEITRLVEDSFLAEVAQSRQEAEALRQRLQWSESKRREQEGVRRLRCVECGRSGDDGDLIQGRSSGIDKGADVPSPLHHHVRRYEQDSDSSERQDTQPSSASLTEQLRNIQDEGQTSHLYGPQTGQEDITVRISQEGALCSAGASDDPDSKNVSWTSVKIGDSDSDSDGLESSYEPRQDSEVQVVNNKDPWSVLLPSEGCSKMVSSLHRVSVKSEAELPNTVPVKEEVDMQALWRDQVQSEISPRQIGQSCSRRGIQLGSVFSLASPQEAMQLFRSNVDTVGNERFQFGQQDGLLKNSTSDKNGCAQYNTHTLSNSGMQAVCPVEKPFSCIHCGKSFSRLHYLKEHQRTHTGERPFSCSQCGRSFSKLSNLKAHCRVHTGERPYNCMNCGKRFTLKSNLKRHQRIHTGMQRSKEASSGKANNRWISRHL